MRPTLAGVEFQASYPSTVFVSEKEYVHIIQIKRVRFLHIKINGYDLFMELEMSMKATQFDRKGTRSLQVV